MNRELIHYGIHFMAPLLVALFFFKSNWKITFLILIATMLIDLDHLLASPVFDPNRCSINFHPLHRSYAIGLYAIGLCFKKTQLIAIGLLIHMIADTLDCMLL